MKTVQLIVVVAAGIILYWLSLDRIYGPLEKGRSGDEEFEFRDIISQKLTPKIPLYDIQFNTTKVNSPLLVTEAYIRELNQMYRKLRESDVHFVAMSELFPPNWEGKYRLPSEFIGGKTIFDINMIKLSPEREIENCETNWLHRKKCEHITRNMTVLVAFNLCILGHGRNETRTSDTLKKKPLDVSDTLMIRFDMITYVPIPGISGVVEDEDEMTMMLSGAPAWELQLKMKYEKSDGMKHFYIEDEAKDV